MAAFCQQCGTPAAPGDEFCAECGQPLTGQAPTSQPASPHAAPPPPGTPGPPWYRQTSGVIGLGLGAAALVVTGVLVFSGGSGEGTPIGAPPASVQPTQPSVTSAPIVSTTTTSSPATSARISAGGAAVTCSFASPFAPAGVQGQTATINPTNGSARLIPSTSAYRRHFHWRYRCRKLYLLFRIDGLVILPAQ